MKQTNLLFSLFVFSAILAIGHADTDQIDQQSYQQQGRDRYNSLRNTPCDPKECRFCYTPGTICIGCQNGYDWQQNFTCKERKEFEDRGDGFSKAYGIINIILIVVCYFGWMYSSRKNMQRFLNGDKLQDQTNQNGIQIIQDNDFEAQIIKIGAPSEFDTRSKKSSTVEPFQYDEKEMQQKFTKKSTNQQPVFEIEKSTNTKGNNNNNNVALGYPVNQDFNNQQGVFIPQFQPSQIQQQQGQQQQQQNSSKPFVTSDLNGYWLTQAGRFSFKNFSNFHRIKHVLMNIIILQRIYSTMFREAQGRGNDDDDTIQKQLLFLAFLICIIIYWFATFIPPIVIKIFSYCWCLKTDPNGRCSNIFINILFYVFAIIMIVLTTGTIFRMSGFEAQVFLLVCISAWLIILFFDKKSVEYAKRNRGGLMERLIKFRKIDFSSVQENQPIAQ